MATWYTSDTSPSGPSNVGYYPSNKYGLPQSQYETSSHSSRVMKLPLSFTGTTKRSVTMEKTSPQDNKGDFVHDDSTWVTGTYKKVRQHGGNSRFPRIEDMPHFHYDFVDLGEQVKIGLYTDNGGDKRYHNGTAEEGTLLVNVICRGKSWILTRTIGNLRLLDRALHRCLFDRNHSKLKSLARLPDSEKYCRSEECFQVVQAYLARVSELADDAMNCSAVLNWLELDNHGNHTLLTDESPINVPGIAAAHVVKRYTAQAVDELSLEVGGIISVIDMPPVDESLWWRGKQGFEVGFFPSQCVEVISDKTDGNTPLPGHAAPSNMTPVAKKRGKIVSFLRLFLSSRPSKARLLQSGILKERTFGCDLGEHLVKTNQQVPLVLVKCAEVIEKNGIVDGIYRLSGMSSNIQKLRLAFDGEEPPDLLKDCYIRDIHCISSLLKMYFRELPNPLLTYHLYDKFVTAIHISDELQRQIAVHHVVQQLPPPHYRTLEYLLRHLSHVASFSPQTGMHAKNLAIVWSPNLLRPMSLDSGGAALLQVNVQAVIVEYLIKNVHVFFDEKAAAAAIVANPRYSSGSWERQQKIVADSDIAGAPSLGPRMASLSISPPTKLISLEEARARAQTTPSRPSGRLIRAKSVEEPQRVETPVYRTSVEVPARRKTSEGSMSGRKWKTFFSHKGKNLEAPSSVAKVQETSQGTYFTVMREPRPQREVGVEVRQAQSAENVNEVYVDSQLRPARARHVRSDVNHTAREITTPVHQPVTISFTRQPARQRGQTSSEMNVTRHHPVLTKFKRVSSDQTVFYTKVEYHPVRTNHRRASTGGDELELSTLRRREIQPSEHSRPISHYENRPRSIYDNEPTPQRYSSPVFSQNCHTITEEQHRYSTPANMGTPPMKKSSRRRLSDQQIAITGARLAHASVVPCSNSGRPMH